MPANDALVDSSFLYSLFNQPTIQNEAVMKASRQLRGRLIVPDIILTEVAFLFRRFGGIVAVAQFLTSFVAAGPILESVAMSDLIRARDIMNLYSDAKLDFVDCCIVAMAERLNISRIATLDQRDFHIIRPIHCEALDLLP